METNKSIYIVIIIVVCDILIAFSCWFSIVCLRNVCLHAHVKCKQDAKASVFILVGWQKLLFETYGQEDGKKKKKNLNYFFLNTGQLYRSLTRGRSN